MRYFVCLIDLLGPGIAASMQERYEALPRARGFQFAWQAVSQAGTHSGIRAAVLTVWDDPWGDPLVARAGDHVAMGMVRLDNREELERSVGCIGDQVLDLELVRRVVARHGAR